MNENDKIIKPDWFDNWFEKKFPFNIDEFTPKDLASGFRCSETAIYNRLRACEIDHLRNGKGKNGYIIPRECVYNYAISCYCLNEK